MKQIELTGKFGKGKYAIVDDIDYDYINKWKWTCKNGYGYRSTTDGSKKKKKHLLMHRIIMCVTDKNVQIDHADGNQLNNQRSNLRIATNSQNQANKKKSITVTSSIYKGVTPYNYNGYKYWIARCSKNREHYRKYCKTEMEAVIWYNEKAIELYGEFALVNIMNNEVLENENFNEEAYMISDFKKVNIHKTKGC